jgi:hypothetical protein
MKRKKQKLIAATVIVWAMVTAIGAFLYALIETRSPIEEPVFQSMWGWHLLMFAIYFLPISLIILGVILWFEHRHFPSEQPDSR